MDTFFRTEYRLCERCSNRSRHGKKLALMAEMFYELTIQESRLRVDILQS
jgi:hypothetical protein